MNSKVYAVIEHGGTYDDSWQHLVGVCSSSELADELKAKIEESHNKPCRISEYDWNKMNEELWDYEGEHGPFDDLIIGMKTLFPHYSEYELVEAADKYDSHNDYVGVCIFEVPYITDKSEL